MGKSVTSESIVVTGILRGHIFFDQCRYCRHRGTASPPPHLSLFPIASPRGRQTWVADQERGYCPKTVSSRGDPSTTGVGLPLCSSGGHTSAQSFPLGMQMWYPFTTRRAICPGLDFSTAAPVVNLNSQGDCPPPFLLGSEQRWDGERGGGGGAERGRGSMTHSFQDADRLLAEPDRVEHVVVEDGLKQIVLVVSLEGGLPRHHLVHQYPQGPPVH